MHWLHSKIAFFLTLEFSQFVYKFNRGPWHQTNQYFKSCWPSLCDIMTDDGTGRFMTGPTSGNGKEISWVFLYQGWNRCCFHHCQKHLFALYLYLFLLSYTLSNMNWFLRWFLKLVLTSGYKTVRYGRELLTSGFKPCYYSLCHKCRISERWRLSFVFIKK